MTPDKRRNTVVRRTAGFLLVKSLATRNLRKLPSRVLLSPLYEALGVTNTKSRRG